MLAGMAPAPLLDRAALEMVVRNAVGGRAVTGFEIFAPWAVARVRLDRGEPGTVVVKWLRDHPTGVRVDPAQLLTEQAALAFVGEVCPGVAPRLLGVDPGGSLLVIEDLDPRRPLLDLVMEGDARWPAGLDRFARTLGRLHASTQGKAERYYERRAGLGPVDRDRELLRFCEPRPDLDDLSSRLGAPIDATTGADLERVTDELRSPGPFLAISNGDAGVNNFLIDGGDGRLIDFEFAGYRHCLSDVCCLYVPGPQWMTVGDPLADGTEHAYRSTLASSLPEVEDDALYGRGVAAACLTWALLRLGRLRVLDERGPGHESRTQMVSTLEAAARTAERFACFLALSGWLRTLEDRLRRRWPDADVDLAILPLQPAGVRDRAARATDPARPKLASQPLRGGSMPDLLPAPQNGGTYDDPAEERLYRKQRLAAAFRLFSRFGFDEGVAGHITARDPERHETLLGQPLRHALRPHQGVRPHPGQRHGRGRSRATSRSTRAAFAIHSQVHAARPDVVAAAHAHSVYGKAWSALGRLLEPITQDVCAFYEDHALFDDYTGVVVDIEEGKRIAHALGDNKAVILRNHGLLTVGAQRRRGGLVVHHHGALLPGPAAGLGRRHAGADRPRDGRADPDPGRLATSPAGSASSRSSTASCASSPTCSTDLRRAPALRMLERPAAVEANSPFSGGRRRSAPGCGRPGPRRPAGPACARRLVRQPPRSRPRAAIRSKASASASRVSGLSVSVGSIMSASSTMSGKCDRRRVEALLEEALGDVEGTGRRCRLRRAAAERTTSCMQGRSKGTS